MRVTALIYLDDHQVARTWQVEDRGRYYRVKWYPYSERWTIKSLGNGRLLTAANKRGRQIIAVVEVIRDKEPG